MKKLLVLPFLFLCLVGLIFAAPAAALNLTYTDTTTKAGFDIEYNLSINPGASGYDAVFTIDSNSTSSKYWFIGGFDFKLFEGQGNVVPDIGNTFSLSDNNSSVATNWSIADADNQDVKIWGWSREAGSAGFYLTDLASDLTVANAQKGVLVSGSNSASFAFSFANDGILRDLIPFQVGYFDPPESDGNGRLKFGQLSATLAPEPATLLLLGTGLIGLAGLRRKFRKN